MSRAAIFSLFAFSVYCATAQAAGYRCSVEHYRESPGVKAGALICGEFRFDPALHPSQKQVYVKCHGLTVEFQTGQGPGGREYSVAISPANAGGPSTGGIRESTSLKTKALPAEFQLERSTPFREKKRLLEEAYILDCHLAEG